MTEYIEREAFRKSLLIGSAYLDEDTMMTVVNVLDCFPATDVAPVRHEKWEVIVGSDGKEHMVCTGCRKQQDLIGVFTYCPNCGAKMDLED